MHSDYILEASRNNLDIHRNQLEIIQPVKYTGRRQWDKNTWH